MRYRRKTSFGICLQIFFFLNVESNRILNAILGGMDVVDGPGNVIVTPKKLVKI